MIFMIILFVLLISLIAIRYFLKKQEQFTKTLLDLDKNLKFTNKQIIKSIDECNYTKYYVSNVIKESKKERKNEN